MKTNTLFTPSELSQFKEEGYVVVPGLLGEDVLQGIDDVVHEITETAMASGDYSLVLELEPNAVDDRPVARRIYNPFHQHEAFVELATSTPILDRIEVLIGENIELHHSKLNMKPAKVGSVVEWHQDLTYFPHTNDDLVTTLIYLDDATQENGCLQVLPQQHRGYLNHSNPDGMFAGMVTDDVDSGNFGSPVPLEGPAGSVIFMHCLTPHSSLPNRSSRGRRTIIFEYKATDAVEIEVPGGVTQTKTPPVLLRGKRAQFARFGKISPMIPRFSGVVSSIYDLQAQTREAVRK